MRAERRRLAHSIHVALVVFLAAGLGACTTVPLRGFDQPAPFRATSDPSVVAVREKLAEGAKSLLGKKQIVVRGRRFNNDCTGLVLAIYWYAGIDLARDFNRFTGGDVERIYKTLQREDLLYSNTRPLVGDIIFWDNTYDHNEDAFADDPLSHVGMVTGVDPDGTISYIHYHITRGIIIEHMNLDAPGVQSMMVGGRMKVINSPMRLVTPGRPHPPNWLAGQLYRDLGLGYLLP
jgi:hypothetical protein